MTLSPEQIDNLPVGATYQEKSGNATGTVKKTDKGVEFTANCDSLTVLVEQLIKEVHRFQSENSALVVQLKEQKTEEVNVLTGWQSIQIKGFWLLFITGIILLFNKLGIWKKIIKTMVRILTK